MTNAAASIRFDVPPLADVASRYSDASAEARLQRRLNMAMLQLEGGMYRPYIQGVEAPSTGYPLLRALADQLRETGFVVTLKCRANSDELTGIEFSRPT